MIRRRNNRETKRLSGSFTDACSNLAAAEGESIPPAKI
jgi:hypothetical protein